MSDTVFIAFPRELYDDIVRFSDGRIRPEILAADQVEDWVSYSVEFGLTEDWGDRLEDVAEKYAPHVLAKVQSDISLDLSAPASQPLIWKGVVVPGGSDVRMSYGGGDYYGKVAGGKIVDDSGAYSPSEWASKVAGGTSRNAWRDLWFREPYSKNWVPAQVLRAQAKRNDDHD